MAKEQFLMPDKKSQSRRAILEPTSHSPRVALVGLQLDLVLWDKAGNELMWLSGQVTYLRQLG